jgi:putative colanic acid biosynthesis acetyltransferase WcaF
MEIKNKTNLNSAVFTVKNKLIRAIWKICYLLFFRFSPVPFFELRNSILCLFGANIGTGVKIYPSVKIWLPSNLNVGSFSSIGPDVKVYNQGHIRINNNVIISQGAYLCASTHDYNNPFHPLILAPVIIHDNVWVCTEAFVGPNVTLTEGSVIGARSVVMKSTSPFGVYAGNPALKIKTRNTIDFNFRED